MKRHVGSFEAVGDDGQRYMVDVFADFVDVGTMRDPGDIVMGLQVLRTRDGMAVNRRKQGEYQVVPTGVVIRSSSPSAP